MENKEFLSILDDLYEKEQVLRKTKKEVTTQGQESWTGPNLFNSDFDIVVVFLLVLYYKGVICLKDGCNHADIEREIVSSDNENKDDFLRIWDKYGDKYPYLEEYVDLLTTYIFSAFKNEECEKTLINWINNRYFFIDIRGHYNNETIALDVIYNCEKQLDVNLNCGQYLVNVSRANLFRYFLNRRSKDIDITFFNCDNFFKDKILINKALLSNSSKIQILESEDGSSLVPSSGTYDGAFIQITESDDTYKINKISNVFNVLKEEGFTVILGCEKDNIDEQTFYNYEVPLMFDNNGSFSMVIRKVKDILSIVRYGSFFVYDTVIEDPYWVRKLTECVKHSINTDFYQVLKKEDFKYNRSYNFKDVSRLLDQFNFIWKKKSDVYSISESCEEWLDNANVEEDKIISFNKLSQDPFKISAGNRYNLSGFINKDGDAPHLLSECEFKRVNSYAYNYSIPGKYAGIFLSLYDVNGKIESEEEKRMDKYFCCRIATEPCLLFSDGSGILRVNASKEAPVCFKKFGFFFTDDTYQIECHTNCDIIKINPEYDENFIIYQLLNQRDPLNSTHILVAPTIEEQHTYFLNKRLDYISKFQPVIDEMESEVNKSIAESPACITGAGFTNFRKFSLLPTIPFKGVNIFVGGNNAGKSTLVKGMLLALDNLKRLVLDDNDSSAINPKFQFDATDMHDVHVGTFNRAFSYFAVRDEDNPGRRCMSYTLSCAHFDITLSLVPTDDGDGPTVPISKIAVVDKKRNAQFVFDYERFTTSAKFTIGSEEIDYHTTGFKVKMNRGGENLITTLIRSIIPSENHRPNILENEEQLQKMKGKSGFILEIADELERVIRNVSVEYIYAHGVAQKVLYNLNDRNDYMAQTLHDLLSEKIGDVENEFIKRWLDVFGIGKDYDVSTIGGEAYIIQLKKENGRMVYLADMGMGANQLVILIFRLAIIIHKLRMLGETPYKPTIVIEEPEQNMHPEFQSKLASLFYEVNKTYGFNFIVETHSEYLVRKSQVIVAEQKYADENELNDKNQFKVYYFPTDGVPYEMQYRVDGNFSNEFGKGFYDEANKLLFEII